MLTSDFDYHLPETSIAQTPAEPRDSSRLPYGEFDLGFGDFDDRVEFDCEIFE